MIQRLIHDVLKSEVIPVGEMADFFTDLNFSKEEVLIFMRYCG